MQPYDVPEILRAELDPGERVLWSGRPRQGLVFGRVDLYLVPFSVVIMGFICFLMQSVLAYPAPPFIAFLTLAFCVPYGLYMLAGRFAVDMWARARTLYAGRFMNESLLLPLPQFLTIEECPPEWRGYDLYLFRDETVVFYAGQSACAFERVWEHIHGGPRGHSTVGRFVLCNWPRSARFTIELWSSKAERFAGAGAAARSPKEALDAAERQLIEEYAPCFNEALNRSPTPLPAAYAAPAAQIRHLRSYRRMMQEARFMVRRGR